MGPSLNSTINVVIENYNAIASQNNWEPVQNPVTAKINITCEV
jgi:hypothetical protein